MGNHCLLNGNGEGENRIRYWKVILEPEISRGAYGVGYPVCTGLEYAVKEYYCSQLHNLAGIITMIDSNGIAVDQSLWFALQVQELRPERFVGLGTLSRNRFMRR